MKLKRLYEEVEEQQRNIVALDKEKAREILLTECKQTVEYIKHHLNDFIYRGFGMHITGSMLSKNDYSLVAPFKRTSRNTFNFYTLIIDNDPAWHNFPKRSESLICSTSDDLRSYGKMRTIIPYDHTVFGVCDGTDMWFSFKFSDKFPFRNLDEFNSLIAKIVIKDEEQYKFSGNVDAIREFNKKLSYQEFVDKIEEAGKKGGKIDHLIQASYDNHYFKMNHDVLIFLTRMKNEGIELLQSCLNPNKHNFRLSKYEELPFNATYERELWFSNQGVVFNGAGDRIDDFFKLIS